MSWFVCIQKPAVVLQLFSMTTSPIQYYVKMYIWQHEEKKIMQDQFVQKNVQLMHATEVNSLFFLDVSAFARNHQKRQLSDLYTAISLLHMTPYGYRNPALSPYCMI